MPTSAGLRFTVVEDGVLDGALSDATRPGAPATTPFGLLSAPAHGTLELRDDGRAFRYVPEPDFNGTDGFDYGAFEGTALRATIDVTPLPDDPELAAVPTLVAEVGRPYARALEARDVDGDALRFEARGLPGWLALDAATGALSGTPSRDDLGRIEDIVFVVVDTTGRRDESPPTALEVVEVAETPGLDLSGFPESLDARETLSVEVLPEGFPLEGVTLDVETDPAVAARVDGRTVTLEASDVETVTDIVVTLVLNDRLGQTRRAVVPLTVHPLTASGRGRTLLGGRTGRGVHLVVLGDGYRREEQRRLRDDAEALIELMRRDPGTARHLPAFNVHVIESVSAESGADDGEFSDERDTLFDSYFACRGVPQLLCANTLGIAETALDEYPDFDHTVLFVNDERFGGSGASGSVAIASRGSPGVALHELGHTLADLGDEYVDGELVAALAPEFFEGRYPNVTAIADPADVPWAHWIEDPARAPRREGETGVGVFEGALYRPRGVYRPTSTSRMREFDVPFGPVNAERWVLGVYRTAGIVRAFEPFPRELEIVAGETQRFSVTPFFDPEVQSIEWSLNGERVRQADDARVFEVTPPAGLHRVRLSVSDVSDRIRLEPPHGGFFEWEWELLVR